MLGRVGSSPLRHSDLGEAFWELTGFGVVGTPKLSELEAGAIPGWVTTLGSCFVRSQKQNRAGWILGPRTIVKDLINAEDVDQLSVVDNVSTAVAIVLQQTAWPFRKGNSTKGMLSLCSAVVMARGEEIIGEIRKALGREKG
ncbi:hypothetical protein L3X38_022615 [Prunus dulcis]|uniref:Uncharacterized protein n=1 Tax=Prunus dulcis TaxID=3755 RepID=A0AAD4VX96_PRUDU|nr:hypothetical protein L3X38_022615 [Prunus dulcis]